MFLLVLDKNPYEAAKKVPVRYKLKQLLELMQMLSCVVNFGYKELPTGKKIKEWIEKHPDWTFTYGKVIFQEIQKKLTMETKIKYECLLNLLWVTKCKRYLTVPDADTAIWRYVEDYSENTKYETNIELPIEDAVKEYERYVEWKEVKHAGRK